MNHRIVIISLVLSLGLGACATTAQPVVYNGKNAQSSEAAIRDCSAQAQAAAGSSSTQQSAVTKGVAQGAVVGAISGVVGGAIYGDVGRAAGAGAAVGATNGLLNGIFRGSNAPNPAYQAYVNKCLADKGFEVVGWK